MQIKPRGVPSEYFVNTSLVFVLLEYWKVIWSVIAKTLVLRTPIISLCRAVGSSRLIAWLSVSLGNGRFISLSH